MWLTNPAIENVVSATLEGFDCSLEDRTLKMTTCIEKLNLSCFGNIFERKKNLLYQITGAQNALVVRWSHQLFLLKK